MYHFFLYLISNTLGFLSALSLISSKCGEYGGGGVDKIVVDGGIEMCVCGTWCGWEGVCGMASW